MSLRKQVESLLPGWEGWYPSLFDAAYDLGIIRARVCPPSALLLSKRHSGITSAAVEAHREKWGGVDLDTESRRRKRGKLAKRSKRR